MTQEIVFRPNEEIVQTVRKHAIVILVPLTILTVLLLVLCFFSIPLFSFGAIGIIIFCLVAAFLSFAALRAWVLWRSTAFIITDQRVIDVDRSGFFEWMVTDVSYENIADISYSVHGPLQAIFRTGNIMVTTVSGANGIEAHFVPHPGKVREWIVVEVNQSRRAEGKRELPLESENSKRSREQAHTDAVDEFLKK